MAEVAITLKLSADEYQLLREELHAHSASLRARSNEAKNAGNRPDSQELLKRQARVDFLREKLG